MKYGIQLDQFFGLDFEDRSFDIDDFCELVGLSAALNNDKTLLQMLTHYSAQHPAITLHKRRWLLQKLRHLYEAALADYDEHYYGKQNKIATDWDRRYGAEDKLLKFCLAVAAGRGYVAIQQLFFARQAMQLRALKATQRHQRLSQLLAKDAQLLLEPSAEQREAKWPRLFGWLQLDRALKRV